MIEVASKRRLHPTPSWRIAPQLVEPNRYPGHPWMTLQPGEIWPTVLQARKPQFVAWSTLLPEHPDARIEFELDPIFEDRTSLRWSLWLPVLPAPEVIAPLRHRVNYIVNDQLRFAFG